jgi:DNA-binding transcriptional regulator YiaG
MPNIATVLKDEIRRLAKREIKVNTSSIKGAAVQFRRDIAKLKRLVQGQQKDIGFLKAQEHKRLSQPETKEEDELEGVRHSARSVRAQRKRLRLSAADFGKVVGVSGLTVYTWEHGKGRPRKERLATLVAVREMGRREALAKLEAMKGQPR